MPKYAIMATMFRRLNLLALILILLPSVSFSEGTNVAAAVSYLGLVPPVRVTFAGGYNNLQKELMPPRLPDEDSYAYFERCRPIYNALFITATLKKKR
jgi:hypothetical protein